MLTGGQTARGGLNPVACLILKVMLEDIPRHGAKLAEELHKVGGEIKRQAELADLYPPPASCCFIRRGRSSTCPM